MANYNRGGQHTHGYVIGSLIEGVVSIFFLIGCIIAIFYITTILLRIVLLFASFACASFSLYSFTMFVQYRNFGSGSGSKIIHSKNKNTWTNPMLYQSTINISCISMTLCVTNGTIAFILLCISKPWGSVSIGYLLWILLIPGIILEVILIKECFKKVDFSFIRYKKERKAIKNKSQKLVSKEIKKEIGPVCFNISLANLTYSGKTYSLKGIKNLTFNRSTIIFVFNNNKETILCDSKKEAIKVFKYIVYLNQRLS